MLPTARPEVQALIEEVIALRRDFHRHPELGFEEVRTSAKVAQFLRESGLEPREGIAKTGVCALIEGPVDGPTLMLRADMDALPILEETDLEFASQVPGKMHACGHDLHTAILLGTARILQGMKARLKGRVKLIFQPAEEGPGGAWPMIEQGILQNPKVDYALGLHLWSDLPCGHVAIQSGPVMAAADTFQVLIHGKGGHAAYPHESADPIVAAAALIGAMQTVISRRTNPFDTAVLSVTQIRGGSADNVIPERVEFSGTIRSFQQPVRDFLVAQLQEMVPNFCKAYGVEGEFHFHQGYPPLINHPVPTGWVEQAVKKLGLPRAVQATMGGEDMAYYLQEVPGAFFFLGAAPAAKERTFPHHHPKFQLDERAVPLAMELFLRCVEECLCTE
ncbi:amidohydrolase [bacterium]|nr:amidohydrolase [bacterium]